MYNISFFGPEAEVVLIGTEHKPVHFATVLLLLIVLLGDSYFLCWCVFNSQYFKHHTYIYI